MTSNSPFCKKKKISHVFMSMTVWVTFSRLSISDLIPSEQCSNCEHVESWRPSESVPQATPPGKYSSISLSNKKHKFPIASLILLSVLQVDVRGVLHPLPGAATWFCFSGWCTAFLPECPARPYPWSRAVLLWQDQGLLPGRTSCSTGEAERRSAMCSSGFDSKLGEGMAAA